MAHFYTARQHSKLVRVDPQSRIAALTEAKKEYLIMVSVADAHVQSLQGVARAPDDVAIARDMLHLLPVQIAKLKSDAIAPSAI